MISVCIATYNGEKYVEQQISSILPQLSSDDEVIVSDDGSQDHTLDIIRSLNDPRIVICLNTRHGFKWNFLNALSHAHGDFVFLSDQDDVWLPGKVKACLEVLQEYDLVVHDSQLADKDLHVFNDSFFTFYHSGKGIIKNSLNNTYFGACMAMRRRVVEAALPFPETDEIGHDIWLGLVAEIIGKTYFLDKPYIIYRRHDLAHTNLAENIWHRSRRSLWTKIWSRVVVLRHVIGFAIAYKLRKE